MKMTLRITESRTGAFNHILNIIHIISWPRFMRAADRSLVPVSSLWDRRHAPASMDGEFMKRETRTEPRFSHGDEMVVKRQPFSWSLQVISMLLKNKKPKLISHIQTILSASVALFVPKCQAVDQTCFILAPSLGGQVFGRNDVSFTDEKLGT